MIFEISPSPEIFGVILRASGQATYAEFERHVRAVLADPRWRPGLNVLEDLTDLDTGWLSTNDVRRIADLQAGLAAEIGRRVPRHRGRTDE
jgi:hypothetical protein